MPRTVPGSISAKIGSGAVLLPLWLVELHPVGGSALYLSSGISVTFGGNVYTHDRVKSVSNLSCPFIDYKNLTFGSASIELIGLTDDGSTAFPYATLEGSINLEGARVFVHLYDAEAGAGVDAIFQGYVKTRSYNDDGQHNAKLEASHLWDCPGIVIPSSTLQQEGFATLDTSDVKTSVIDDTTLPLFWCAQEVQIRPTLYHSRVRASAIQVNGVISGCGPAPFAPGAVTDLRIFGNVHADSFSFEHRGLASDVVPGDLTKYPDGLAHNNIAYFTAKFPITDDDKNQVNQTISNDEVKITIANGRPLIDTGLPSSNGVLIYKDGLRDPRFGLGMASTDFDDLSAAATQAGTWWTVRHVLSAQQPVGDWTQRLMTQLHGFVTWNGRKLKVGIKTPSETPVATYATRKSGHAGLEICNDKVTTNFDSADTLINQINATYRLANWHPKKPPLVIYDGNSQGRLGGTIRTVNPTDFEWDAVFVDAEVQISGSQWLREDQNENMRISLEVPLVEGLAPLPGELITVWSEDIPNNATNNVFRLITPTFNTGPSPTVTFECRLYYAGAHQYNTSGIGFDNIRSDPDSSNRGRPANVTPVSLNIFDITANDTQGKTATIRAIWTYPTIADGDLPIARVELWWHYTDESINAARLGTSVVYPTPQADFQIDYQKSRSIECFFVAIGPSGGRAPLGYIPDETKTTHLAQDIGAGGNVAFFVGSTTGFAVNDYIFIEKEIDRIAALSAGQINCVPNVAGPRTTFFDTVAIAHPTGTQIAVAKLSYPSLTKSLNVPRFTYPAVTAINVLQRPDGVKTKIADVSADNVEDYYIYWSITADPGAGSATPAWYLSDPLTPPAGVNYISGKVLHQTIPQEIIGPAGTTVWVRVAARNGKHNWSTALSPVGSNKVGDDAVPIANAPNVIPNKRGLRIIEPLPALNMKTFPTSGKIEIVIQARNAADAILGYLTDVTGAYTSQAPNEFRFDYGLAKGHPFNLGKDTVLGIWPTVDKLHIYAYVTNAVGTSLPSAHTLINVSTWEVLSDGALVPGAMVFPTSLVENTVDGDPEHATARVVFPLTTANGQSLSSNNVSEISLSVVEFNEGSPGYIFASVSAIGVGSQLNTFNRTLYLRMGHKYRLLTVFSINGDKRTAVDGAFDFIAGNVTTVSPGDPKVVPAPTFQIQPAADGNKTASFTVRLAQNGTDIILFKNLLVEIAFGGGAFKQQSLLYLKALDDLHSSANPAVGFHDFPITCHRKPGVTLDVRVSAKAIGGKSSAVTNAVQLGQSADDVAVDTGFPNNGAVIAITHAALKNGRSLIARFVTPTAQMAQHVTNYLVIHDNNQTGAGRRFFEPATQLWVAAYSDGTTQMDIGKGGVPPFTTPVSALSVGGRTRIYIVIGVKNAFNGGSTTYSVDVPGVGAIGNIDLSTGGVEPVDQDAAVPDPSALAPVMRFDGKFAVVETPLPAVNMNTFTKVELAIKALNTGVTIGWLTRDVSGHYAFSAAEVFFDMGRGKEYDLNLKKVSLLTLFPNITHLEFYYFVSNSAKGRSASSSVHPQVSIDTITDYLGTRNVPNVIDVGLSLFAMQNLVDNGEFDKNDPANTVAVQNWYQWQSGSLAVAGVGANIFSIRASSGGHGIIWSKTQDNVAIIDGSWYLVRPIGPILRPGVYYSLSMDLRAAINGFSFQLGAWVIKDGAVSTPGAAAINLRTANLLEDTLIVWRGNELGGLSSALYKAAGNYRKCPLATDLSATVGGNVIYPNLWLVIGVPTGFGPPNQMIIDRIKFNASAQPSSFSTAPSEVVGVVDVGSTGIIPGNVGDLPDVGLPSGLLGGYGSGGGGIVLG